MTRKERNGTVFSKSAAHNDPGTSSVSRSWRRGVLAAAATGLQLVKSQDSHDGRVPAQRSGPCDS